MAKSKEQVQREAFDWLMKTSKQMAEQAGNGVKVTEREIRQHCEKVADNAHKRRKELGKE